MQVERFGSEADLLTGFSEAVLALDPDIIVGWEVQQGSIGFLVDRAAILEIQLLRAMSRTPEVHFQAGTLSKSFHADNANIRKLLAKC